jgi:endoglucanase
LFYKGGYTRYKLDMNKDIYKFLTNILATPSPSGCEEEVLALYSSIVFQYVDEVYSDAYGNVIAHKKGKGTKKLMLMAHADEVGLMVTYIDDNGYLYFQKIGGVDTNLLTGLCVEIQGTHGVVTGVIGKKAVHLLSKEDCGKDLKTEDLWIDIGVKDKADALRQVQIGCCATFTARVLQLTNNRIVSKSLDNKIGIAIMVDVARQLSTKELNIDIYFVASVQEELGSRGARTATLALAPDIGIAIDVTHATDYPTMSPVKDGDIKLGKGVVIPIGPNINKKVNKLLLQIAKDKGLEYQIEPISHPTGTDANLIQISGTGVMTGLVCVPCRYMHSANEIVDIADAETAISLLAEFCKSIDKNIVTPCHKLGDN